MRGRMACWMVWAGFAVTVAGGIGRAAHAHEYDIGGTFELTRVETGAWRATYCLDTTVVALRWDETMPGMREAAWTPETPGFQMTHSAGSDGLTAEGSRPFDCVSFRISTYTALGPKHYYAFSPFSDGGVFGANIVVRGADGASVSAAMVELAKLFPEATA